MLSVSFVVMFVLRRVMQGDQFDRFFVLLGLYTEIRAPEILTKSKTRVVQSGRLKKEAALDHRAKVMATFLISCFVVLSVLFLGPTALRKVRE